MRKVIYMALTAMLMAACSSEKKGEVTINLPKDLKVDTLIVSHVTIENNVTAKTADDVKVYYDTLLVKNGEAKMTLDPIGPARYEIVPPVQSVMSPEIYASPEDNLDITIEKFNPLSYQVKGSELMEDLTVYASVSNPIQIEYASMLQNGSMTPEKADSIMKKYDDAVKKFVADHPKSPAVPFVIMQLDPDDFKPLFDNMTPEAKKSILYPYAQQYDVEVEKAINERNEEDARKAEVASGKKTAPDFTLPDLAGKMVSLSDFKGKWVVLDFWGSWCGWCVKGFPALKEAYKKYGDKIVVIGIDCNESEADWRAGVKQHQLPWLNLYNGENRELYTAYNIEGFPTKAIINPEGKLVDLTTGEDPTFYDRLASFVK